jgi:hypothetical protein
MYRVGPFMSGGGWLLSLVVFAAFILLIAWGVAWILRRDARRYGPPPPTTPMPPVTPPPPPIDPALQILRERFARGEIGEAEFLNASRALGAPLPPPRPPAGPPVGPAS